MSKLFEAYKKCLEQKEEDMYTTTHPPKRSLRQLTAGQNTWLKKQPADYAYHIRCLLAEDKSYGFKFLQESRTYALTVLRNSNT